LIISIPFCNQRTIHSTQESDSSNHYLFSWPFQLLISPTNRQLNSLWKKI